MQYVQATIAAPVKGKMLKGLCMCYTVVVATFFTVAISGYWAFGNKANGLIFTNFFNDKTDHYLVPTWFIFLINLFTVLQLAAVAVVYCYTIKSTSFYILFSHILLLILSYTGILTAYKRYFGKCT